MPFVVAPSRKPDFWALVEGRDPKAKPKPKKTNAKPPAKKAAKKGKR